MRKSVMTSKYLIIWRFVYLIIILFFVGTFLSMIFPILLSLIPRVLTMNPISASGHSALWKNYGLNHLPPAEKVKIEPSHSSPSRTIDSYQAPCSSLLPCVSHPEWLSNATHRDTPKSIELEPIEEHHESSSSPVITRE